VESPRLQTERLEVLPLPPAAAAALPDDRGAAASAIGAALSPDWPAADLLDVLPMQARAGTDEARFGIWVIVERSTRTVVGDIGFLGAPSAEGSVEIGYSIVTDRRRRGYATEAARALVSWALEQPGVDAVLARCASDNEASIRTLERVGFSRSGAADGRLRWRLDPG
jgi:RimJ/RimL family protein N-acetyltransferase